MPQVSTRLTSIVGDDGSSIVEVIGFRVDYTLQNGDPDPSQGVNGRDWRILVVLDGLIIIDKLYPGDASGLRLAREEAGMFVQRQVTDEIAAGGETFNDLINASQPLADFEAQQAVRARVRDLLRKFVTLHDDLKQFIASADFATIPVRQQDLGNALDAALQGVRDDLDGVTS